MTIGYETKRSAQRARKAHSASDHFHHRKRHRERLDGRSPFEQAFSSEALFLAFQRIALAAGSAPGVDGIRWDDLGPKEIGQIVGVLSRSILDGTYRPHPTRSKFIPKAGTTEKRELRIGTIFDRLVARVLVDLVQPHWEPRFRYGQWSDPQLFAIDPVAPDPESQFLNRSWGFRPGRGIHQMLAEMVVGIEDENLWVVTTDDIRKAFDNVQIAAVLEAHRRAGITDSRLMTLIEAVLRGSNPGREIGIDQGCPFSPLGLNALLHFVHDVPFDEAVNKPRWFRYADNLAYLGRSVTEGRQMLDRARSLLEKVGMTLKAERGPANLAQGDQVPLLGINLSQSEGRVHIGLGKQSWLALQTGLEEAHAHPDPVTTACQAVRGWVDSLGAALENGKPVRRILTIAAEAGFREIGSLAEVADWVEAAGQRWQRRVAATRYLFHVTA